jgi:hypothetical protein
MASRTHVRSPRAHPLTLDYDAGVPEAKLVAMEQHAKRLGLPLATLEMLGQDEALCDAFIRAAAAGHGAAFARALETTGRAGVALPLPTPRIH